MRDYVTTIEAAAMLGVSEQSIRYYLSRGLLRSEMVGGSHLIRRSAIEKFRRPKMGRPPGKSKKSQAPAQVS